MREIPGIPKTPTPYTLVFSVVRVIMNPVTFKVSVFDLRKLKTRNARVHVTSKSHPNVLLHLELPSTFRYYRKVANY
jgi:hypothetical protein